MTTENSGKSLLIVCYDWTLENVEKDFKTVASNLILFRDEIKSVPRGLEPFWWPWTSSPDEFDFLGNQP